MDIPSDEISALIDKVHAYCSTELQDFDRRQALLLTDQEKAHLHQLAWLGVVPWNDYYDFQDFKLADLLWQNPKEGLPTFKTIDQVRAWVQWKERREYKAGDKQIREVVYNRFLPSFRYIRRTITQPPNKALQETISHIEEVEFSNLHPSRDFDTAWAKLIKTMQTDAVEHFKWSVEDALSDTQREHLQQLVLLGKVDVQLVYTMSQGVRKESKQYSLLEAYQPLLQQATEQVTRVQEKEKGGFDDLTHDTSAQQLENILDIVKTALLKWDSVRGPLPAWLQFKLKKETARLSHRDYRPPEQQPDKRDYSGESEIPPESVRGRRHAEGSVRPNIDSKQTSLPMSADEEESEDEAVQLHTTVKIAMRKIMIRELGETHYERRFIDDISAADFAKECGPTMNRNSIAKREERARQVAFTEITAKFGPRTLQSVFRH